MMPFLEISKRLELNDEVYSLSDQDFLACIAAGLCGPLAISVVQWRTPIGAKMPGLLESGIRYSREARDTWSDIFGTYNRGRFDCEDGSTGHAAEGRVRLSHPWRTVYVSRVHDKLVHVFQGDGRGSYFDISAERGMVIPEGIDLAAIHRRGVPCPLPSF